MTTTVMVKNVLSAEDIEAIRIVKTHVDDIGAAPDVMAANRRLRMILRQWERG